MPYNGDHPHTLRNPWQDKCHCRERYVYGGSVARFVSLDSAHMTNAMRARPAADGCPDAVLQFLYGRTFPAEDRRTVELLIMLIAHICGEPLRT